MKKLLFAQIAFIVAFFFFSITGNAQVASTTAAMKTVIYKIRKPDEQKSLTPQQVIDIDKLLASKKGIISSNTNGVNRMVSVKMETNFPEEEIKKLLGSVFKLEIESYEVVDNSK